MNKIKVIEMFGGIGAATQALKRQFGKDNIDVIDYVELDKHAVKSYNLINDTNFVPTDINDVDVSSYPEVDIVIAGWPCQDYSIAGKGLGLEGTRSNLILLTISKIKEMANKPKHILLENVKGLLSNKHSADLQYIKELFDELGYEWNQAMLNSKYFGVPQARERVFIALTRKDLTTKKINQLEDRKEVSKVLSDVLDFNEETQKVRIDNNNKIVYFVNEMSQYNGKIIQLDQHKLNNQERDAINKVAILGTIEETVQCKDGSCYTLVEICECDNYVAIKEFKDHTFNQKKHFLGIEGVAKTLRAGDCDSENKIIFKDVSFNQDKSIHGIDGQAPTLTTSGTTFKAKIAYDDNMVINYRKLSTLECWRLMGFSDDAHNKCKNGGVSSSQLAKQAGNSIVVNVLEAIFEEIFKEVNNG